MVIYIEMLYLLSFSDSWYHNSLSVYYTLFGGSPTSWFMNNFAFSEIMRALKESNVLYRIWNTTQFIRVKTPVYLHNIHKLFSFKRVLCSTTQKSRAHFQNNT